MQHIYFFHFSLDTTASEICQFSQSNDDTPDPEAEPVAQSPKMSLNLAGLKAAFSSHSYSNSGSKSNVAKAVNTDCTQKTLQSFFKSSAKPTNCTPTVKSPMKPGKCSPVGKSVLDGFRYGAMCSDTDTEKDSALSSCDNTMIAPDTQHSGLELKSPEVVNSRAVVKEETFEVTAEEAPEEKELQAETRPFKEDCTVSPDAKRARTENSPGKHKTNVLEKSSFMVDTPVCLQRRTVPLQFSLQELAGKMKRLQDQQALRAKDALHYRRFKAKINPGENQSAEEELKKEIRYDLTSLTAADLSNVGLSFQ